MTDSPVSSVAPDQLRIAVEVGDTYEPSERLAAALTELTAALHEVGDDNGVEGFMFDVVASHVHSFAYDSRGTGPGDGSTGWTDGPGSRTPGSTTVFKP